MTRRIIKKQKSIFQPDTNKVFPDAKVSASLSSISVSRKKSPVITDYIISRVDIVGPELRFFCFVGHIDIRIFHGSVLIRISPVITIFKEQVIYLLIIFRSFKFYS